MTTLMCCFGSDFGSLGCALGASFCFKAPCMVAGSVGIGAAVSASCCLLSSFSLSAFTISSKLSCPLFSDTIGTCSKVGFGCWACGSDGGGGATGGTLVCAICGAGSLGGGVGTLTCCGILRVLSGSGGKVSLESGCAT